MPRCLVKQILLAQDKEIYEVGVCSLFPRIGSSIEDELEKNGITVYYLNKRLGPNLRILREVYGVLKKFKPQVIHTHRYVIRYTLIPSLLCRIPVRIHTIHNIAEKEVDFPGRIIHFLAFKMFNYKPVGISQYITKSAGNYYGINNMSCVYNCIATELYLNKHGVRKEVRLSLNLFDDDFAILHVGRFFPQKNHRLLIEAFSKVVKAVTNAVLFLVGDGELRAEMEELVREKGLSKNVRFLGIRDDVPDLLAASDVLVLPSDWEGLPLTVLEAMAAGKAVIATSVGGVPELITDGVNGFLVQPGDAEALAGAMIKLAEDPGVSRKMGQIGEKLAQEKFDIKIMAKEYEKLYLDGLNQTRFRLLPK